MRPRAAALAAALAFAASAAPAQTENSATYTLRPYATTQGGRDDTVSATNYKLGGAVGVTGGGLMTSASYASKSGLRQVLAYPSAVTNLAPASDLRASSATLAWTAPGYDGSVGALQAGSSYFMLIATYVAPNPFVVTNYNIFLATNNAGTSILPGVTVGTMSVGMLPNNTYYAQLWTADADGDMSYASAEATFTMLAPAPLQLAQTFVNVWETSVTVNWQGLPYDTAYASNTNEGWELSASSAADFSGTLFSSATPAATASTLTVGAVSPLLYCTTYYFRVASLNWTGAKDYVFFPSTITFQNLNVNVSTHDLNVGGVNVGATGVVISTSFYVYNNSDCPVTFDLAAATTTPGSAWVLASAPAQDQFSLYAVFDGTQPPSGNFVSTDRLSNSFLTSDATNFALGQTGTVVPKGDSRLLWFRLDMPTVVSTDAVQALQISVREHSP